MFSFKKTKKKRANPYVKRIDAQTLKLRYFLSLYKYDMSSFSGSSFIKIANCKNAIQIINKVVIF